ncbi:MAG: phosphoglycerate kinase [Candidatus Latescibacteria bacterium]|nr:phosphoglycerate kinase [Candidatus Latescibacterota bacterium]
MAKKSIADIEPAGARILVRADFNVPQDEEGRITDDARIRAALPTLEQLLGQGAALVLMSHLGRPKGQPNPKLSLAPVARRLEELLGCPVALAADCVGADVERQAKALAPGQILLLENLRFHAAEEGNDPVFAVGLAALGEIYVNDAFGTAHRAHASTEGITHHIATSVSGLLMAAELRYLNDALSAPKRPFLGILGGSKVSSKIKVIQHLLGRVDALLIGGGMAYTFFKAMGLEIGSSLLEEDRLGLAQQILRQAEGAGVELLLPVDCVVAADFAVDAARQTVLRTAFPPNWQGLDIGPETRRQFSSRVAAAQTVVWNGPLGVFEMEPFAAGTRAVAQALATATQTGQTTSIIGGGDTAAAIAQAGLVDQMSHISTGGGASLECMAGRVLPGVAALDEKET